MKRKSNILTIMKKEFRRFFGDRRMILTILLPGILIYVIYSLMGDGLMDSFEEDGTTIYCIGVSHHPETVDEYLTAMADATGTTVEVVYRTAEDAKAAVTDGTLDIYVELPADFDEQVMAYDPQSGAPAPEARIYYNSASTTSQTAYALMVSVLDQYEAAIANRMDINRDPSVTYDLAAPEDVTGMIFSMLMPMLLVMLTFSGCMAMTTESIAGEKERGTIATLLVTPVRRSELAMGKIAALSVISLLAGLSGFLGILLSLPKLMGGTDMGLVDASVYTVGDYGVLLALILSTVLLFVSMIAVLSALAGSVKEAAGFVTPLMLVVTVIGVSGMFGSGEKSLALFLIPIYNTVQCISGVFSMAYTPVQILLTVLSNVTAAGLFVLLLTRMFMSEKIMFKK